MGKAFSGQNINLGSLQKGGKNQSRVFTKREKNQTNIKNAKRNNHNVILQGKKHLSFQSPRVSLHLDAFPSINLSTDRQAAMKLQWHIYKYQINDLPRE